MRATVSHFEIPAHNIERAADFYREVFAWRVEPQTWGEGLYCQVRTPDPEEPSSSAVRGAIQGGLVPAQELGSDQPLLVIHLSGTGLRAVLEKVTAAGGQVVATPRQVGEAGEFARFRDTEGNLLGLWLARERLGGE